MGDTVGGVLRRGSDRIIAGVCAGLAEYFHLDSTLVRVVFVILSVAPPGIGILLYLVLWFLMEPPGGTGTSSRSLSDRFRRMGDEVRKEFRGGLWHAPEDTGSTTPPPVPQPPGNTAPQPPPTNRWGGSSYRGRPGGLWAGIVLIALGAYFLVANLGFLRGFRWDLFWPVILIAIGLLVLLRRSVR